MASAETKNEAQGEPGRAAQGDASTAAWDSLRNIFFNHLRPRMLELWREFDLAPPQVMALGMLEQPRPMGELASKLHCDSSNITWIVDKLSERGLVERQAAPHDRRVKLVALTDAGRELRDEIHSRIAEPITAFDVLSAAEAKTLAKILGKLELAADSS